MKTIENLNDSNKSFIKVDLLKSHYRDALDAVKNGELLTVLKLRFEEYITNCQEDFKNIEYIFDDSSVDSTQKSLLRLEIEDIFVTYKQEDNLEYQLVPVSVLRDDNRFPILSNLADELSRPRVSSCLSGFRQVLIDPLLTLKSGELYYKTTKGDFVFRENIKQRPDITDLLSVSNSYPESYSNLLKSDSFLFSKTRFEPTKYSEDVIPPAPKEEILLLTDLFYLAGLISEDEFLEQIQGQILDISSSVLSNKLFRSDELIFGCNDFINVGITQLPYALSEVEDDILFVLLYCDIFHANFIPDQYINFNIKPDVEDHIFFEHLTSILQDEVLSDILVNGFRSGCYFEMMPKAQTKYKDYLDINSGNLLQFYKMVTLLLNEHEISVSDETVTWLRKSIIDKFNYFVLSDDQLVTPILQSTGGLDLGTANGMLYLSTIRSLLINGLKHTSSAWVDFKSNVGAAEISLHSRVNRESFVYFLNKLCFEEKPIEIKSFIYSILKEALGENFEYIIPISKKNTSKDTRFEDILNPLSTSTKTFTVNDSFKTLSEASVSGLISNTTITNGPLLLFFDLLEINPKKFILVIKNKLKIKMNRLEEILFVQKLKCFNKLLKRQDVELILVIDEKRFSDTDFISKNIKDIRHFDFKEQATHQLFLDDKRIKFVPLGVGNSFCKI